MQSLSVVLVALVLIYQLIGSFVSANSIIAARCKDGIVIGCDNYGIDQRKSIFIQNKFSRIIYPLTLRSIANKASRLHSVGKKKKKQEDDRQLLLCCVKNHSSFYFFFKEMQKMILMNQIKYKNDMKIEEIVQYARNLIYRKYPKLSVIVAGYEDCSEIKTVEQSGDSSTKYHLYLIEEGGSLISQDFFTTGEGGILSLGILESLFPSEQKLKLKSADFNPFSIPKLLSEHAVHQSDINIPTLVDLVKKGLQTAISYDTHSGGPRPTIVILSTKPYET
jgi:20S proteasome alpha/beta subunit